MFPVSLLLRSPETHRNVVLSLSRGTRERASPKKKAVYLPCSTAVVSLALGMSGSAVAVTFQSVFRTEIHENDVFFIF